MSYNDFVYIETSEITYEPLDVIVADDPVMCAVYARDNDLLDLPGWKHFKKLATRERQLLCLIRQAKMRSYKSSIQVWLSHPFYLRQGSRLR